MIMNELKQLEIVIKVIERRLKQAETADILCVRIKQVKRLVKQFRAYKEMAISLVEEKYPDFGPTLAQEKLKEIHNLKISISTVRALMIEKELFRPKRHKKKKGVSIQRGRRPRKGDASNGWVNA